MTTTCRFTAFDTWFFRESRPHSSVGAPFLASSFPPPPRTVAGAVRFAIGEGLGADWAAFGATRGQEPYLRPSSDGAVNLVDLIGWGNDLGRLTFRGPWLARRNRATGKTHRLYPAPRLLLTDGMADKVGRFLVGSPVDTDLGRICLPAVPPELEVRLPVDDYWLSTDHLEAVLSGRTPPVEAMLSMEALVTEESRLGIARDAVVGSARTGLLYQTRHRRPHPGVAVEVDVEGLDEPATPDDPVLRLGGEGRPTGTEWYPAEDAFPKAPQPNKATRGLILVLLTAADLGGGWLPLESPTAVQTQRSDAPQTWRGTLGGHSLEVVCSVLAPNALEGGWDLAQRRPRPVRGLIPAGSLWYCRVGMPDGYLEGTDLAPIIQQLHGLHIGGDTRLGRGHLAVGLWQDPEYPRLFAPS